MSVYYLHHVLSFNNALSEDCRIELYKKDEVPTSVTNLIATTCSKDIQSGQGDKFDTILASEFTFGIWLKITDNVTFADFIVSFYDQWQVKFIKDGTIEFIGFLTPAEGTCDFQDKPYELTLAATDGLGFLKQVLLSQTDGTEFRDEYFLMDYIKGCLSKTLLDLPIRAICNIYEISMSDRYGDPLSDIFDKIKLDYRTFQTDPVTFTDCYTALTTIFGEMFSFYQWQGEWVISRVAEMQSSIGAQNFYSLYNTDGTKAHGQYLGGPMNIEQYGTMHPRNADQKIGLNFSNKSAKHTYNFNIWPELPLNNKFVRGTLIPSLTTTTTTGSPPLTLTQKYYTINDWDYGYFNNYDTLPSGTLATDFHAYRRSTYNIYGVETNREIKLEIQPGTSIELQAQGIPVNGQDTITINLSAKFETNFPSLNNYRALRVYLISNSGTYVLQNSLYWTLSNADSIFINFDENGTLEYRNLNITSQTIPEDGLLFISFIADGTIFTDPNHVLFQDFSFTLTPYILGSYVPVKGDYWFTQQNISYSDVIDNEVFISDSTHKVFKGALLRGNGTTGYNSPLTVTSWRRLGVSEQRHYKELVNLGRYNGSYRRTWKVAGTFGGTIFQPSNDHTVIESLSFHRQFAFPQSTELNGYYFMLVPPLTIDYVAGQISATFVDCYLKATPEQDGNQIGDDHEFDYLFDTSV